jgi:mycofactocin system glycosyltransferase
MGYVNGMSAESPPTLRIRVRAGVRTLSGGTLLVGGRPRRIIRLSDAGAEMVRAWMQGRAAPDSAAAATALAARLVKAELADPLPSAWLRDPPTVIVPARDRPDELGRCLVALAAGTRVVVVDDASVDASRIREVCRRHGAEVVRQPARGGPAAARNRGLDVLDAIDAGDRGHLVAASPPRSTAELVAFIDSDVTVTPGWERLAAHFNDPGVVAVAPRIVAAGNRRIDQHTPLDMGAPGGVVGPGERLRYVPTACLIVRRSALSDVRFDEELRYGEDVDLVWRLGAAGGQIRYDPTVVMHHDEPRSWHARLVRQHHYGTSAGPLARRHPGKLAPLRMQALPALVTAAVMARRPAIAALGTAIIAARVQQRLRRAGVPRGLAMAEAWRAAATGVGMTLRATGRAVTQLCWPALLAGLAGRRTRPAAAALLVIDPLADWIDRRPSVDPLRWTAMVTADHVAYGTGVWRGAISARTREPLMPRWVRRGVSSGR